MRCFATRTLFALSITLLSCLGAGAGDWPQLRGPLRDGISKECNLQHGWPASGPRELWRRQLDEGFSEIVVAGGALYTATCANGNEVVVRLDPASGEPVWQQAIAVIFEDSWGDGPRATPTVDSTQLFMISSHGLLVALQTADGKKRWSRDLQQELSAELPEWGFSTSPLVLGDRVFVEVGGAEERCVVAFDSKDGSTVWSAGEGNAAYSSPITVRLGEQSPHLVALTSLGITGVGLDGTMLWSYLWRESGIKPATPVFVAPDLVFVSAAYGVGAAALRLEATDEGITASELWTNQRVMRNHFSSSLALDGAVYGFDNASLKCIDPETGEQHWVRRGGLGKGSLIAADGLLIVLTETGTLKLVEVTQEEYRELASAPMLEGRCWTAPSLADGVLYLRNREEIVAVDLSGRGGDRKASTTATQDKSHG